MKKLSLVFLSLQHFLIMYTGAIVVPLIIGNALDLSSEDISFLISADLLTSGIATLLYSIRSSFIGVGLPVVLGASFNSLAAFITIGKEHGLPTVYGAVIVSGLLVFLLAPLMTRYLVKLPRIIPGIVVTIIGLSLIPVGFEKILPPSSLPLALQEIYIFLFLGTILFIILFQHLAPKKIRNLSVIISLFLFSFLYYCFFPFSYQALQQTPWFHIPTFFHFGFPVFQSSAIVTMVIVLFVTSLESLGNLNALAEICNRPLTSSMLRNSFRAEGLSTLIGGLFNAFTYSNFAQNIGLVQVSGVKKLSVIWGTGGILIALSFIPKVATFTTLIPDPVLGAVMLTMFGVVTASGIHILSQVNFRDHTSIWTLALSLGFGVGVASTKNIVDILPSFLVSLVSNPIVMGSLVALFTHYTLSAIKKGEK